MVANPIFLSGSLRNLTIYSCNVPTVVYILQWVTLQECGRPEIVFALILNLQQVFWGIGWLVPMILKVNCALCYAVACSIYTTCNLK